MEVFGTGVVGAVDYGGDGEAGGDAVFDSGGVLTAAGSCRFRHFGLLLLCGKRDWDDDGEKKNKRLDDNL